MPRPGGEPETPEAQALIRRRIRLWRDAVERGDAGVLAQAVVEQREIPKQLRARLNLPTR